MPISIRIKNNRAFVKFIGKINYFLDCFSLFLFVFCNFAYFFNSRTFNNSYFLSASMICRRLCSTSAEAVAKITADSRLVSGIQPTGFPHIGNYLGFIQNFVRLQNVRV